MCKNLKDFLKIPILVSLFVFFVPFSSFAVVDSAEVSWDPDTSYITVNGGTQKKFSVDIVVDENADSLAQCEMYIRCDKNVLAVDSVSMGSIWEGTGALWIWKDVQIEPTDSNRVSISYTLGGAGAWAHGPGVLARVYFRTRGTGDRESDLVFDSLFLGADFPNVIPSKAIKGKVYVQEGTGVENGTDEMNVIPGYSLLQNYPNPFNPSTCIEFDLARTSQVKLEIYNILGSKVKTLVNDKLSVGHKSITWDGKDDQGKKVASGIYFYRLKTEEFSLTKRMLLLK
jgi:hypothetical protein